MVRLPIAYVLAIAEVKMQGFLTQLRADSGSEPTLSEDQGCVASGAVDWQPPSLAPSAELLVP